MTKPNSVKKLSASRIKCLDTCSAMYFYKYEQKIPDPANEGAILGNVFHEIAEIFLKTRHRYKLLEFVSVGRQSITRLIALKLKKAELSNETYPDLIKSWLIVCLNCDFWLDGGDLKEPEIKFELDQNSYKAVGYIDKHAVFTDAAGDKYVIIQDYKTQKNLFTSEEMDFNIQAITYLIAAKQKYPDINLYKSRVDFILVRYPETPVQSFKLKNDIQVRGCEQYLANIQLYMDSFNDLNISDSLAAKKDYPPKDGGFKGPLVCGRAKAPGQLKKDGTKMYACPYKFPFTYYQKVDKAGTVVYTSLSQIECNDNSFTIVERQHGGCIAFNSYKKYKQEPIKQELPDELDF